MNIVVTGGTGFVGRHLVQMLLDERQHRLHLLVRDDARLQACAFRGPLQVVRGDLFASAPLPADTETVFHLAAATKALGAGEFTRVNVEGTRALLERLRPLPGLKRVALLSSLAAAGPNRGRPALVEEDPAEPISQYGRSKLAQERLMARSGLPHVIIRAPIVFGPGDLDMLAAFRVVRRGILPRLGRAERRYSLVYVADLARAMMAAAFGPCAGETFYAANPDPVEWGELLELAARLLGHGKVRRILVPVALGRVLAELSELRIRALGRKAIFNRDKFHEMAFPAWVCSPAKIEARLHFQPRVPLAAALEETIAWYRGQGLL